MLIVRAVRPEEWAIYRDTRLKALQDSPDAYGSLYGDEVVRTDAMWAERIAAAAASGRDHVLFALQEARVIGMAWCKLAPETGLSAHLYQMWVDPAARGQGAGHALLKEAAGWAARQGAREIGLGVTQADQATPAMRLYAAFGFQPAGSAEPLRAGSTLMMLPMRLQLG